MVWPTIKSELTWGRSSPLITAHYNRVLCH